MHLISDALFLSLLTMTLTTLPPSKHAYRPLRIAFLYNFLHTYICVHAKKYTTKRTTHQEPGKNIQG